ncbi:hypothetical protein G6027_16145 [Dietzia sp. SLG310A2-38A2]|uniref:hypothetical protein n=1 Tax=Dietzia sp. SLG310A2-38A2 TaxID=1630643 RepID=UPI0015FC8E5B|nr:hypothetical protein [Dietzia sp. SLG310A2-38A2]MBB1032381.1 hypothetical protein [Dietzia sp. SLG310A2-38A2]
MHALDHTDLHYLHYLRKTKSLHSLGRLAASPDTEIPSIVASQSSGYGGGLAYEYRRRGLSIWIGTRRPWDGDPDRHVTWTQVRRHVSRYATSEFIDTFRATDSKWCRAMAGDQTPGVLHRRTDAQRQTVAELETLLRLLAAPIWDAATTIEDEPQQLDLFA